MVTYLLPPKWPFLHALPHPFQLGWLILSIFDKVIAGKKSPFPLCIFLSASEEEHGEMAILGGEKVSHHQVPGGK